MVLHSQRMRRMLRDEKEAGGEDLWTEELPREARVKIAGLWEIVERASSNHIADYTFQGGVGRILKIEAGRDIEYASPDLLIKTEDPALALDLIGALHLFLERNEFLRRFAGDLEKHANEVFEDFRIAYRMVDGEIVPIGSDELHTEVVAPTLRLLIGERFKNAHEAYLSAIREVPADPADAITDAGTALQETLTALGCTGNALGPLIRSAKSKGLLAPHDATLTAGIEQFLSWASADRSESGDGHHVSPATRADSWLMIHIVGALIVRLVDPEPRAGTAT